MPNDYRMLLDQAVTRLLNGRPKRWLAEQMDTSESTVSRILKGQTELTVEMIVCMEDVLEVPRGYLFRAMGLVPEDIGFVDRLRTAPNLDDGDRDALARVYEAMVLMRESGGGRTTDNPANTAAAPDKRTTN